MQGLELAPGEGFAVTNVVIQRHAGKGGGMAEYLCDDRHSVGFLELDSRGDPLQAVHWPPPANDSR
jgi:hypothetical protein